MSAEPQPRGSEAAAHATVRVAAIMTVHNRRETTLACLEVIGSQAHGGVQLDVYVVDDGSTDGTAEGIASRFPAVHLIVGDGSLFWNGGMRLGLAMAMRGDYDFYLWLNDDTTLARDALDRLLCIYDEVRRSTGGLAIIAGSTTHPVTGELTYGGRVRPDRRRPLRFDLMPPGDHALPVETMNGNIVLVPRAVVERVGNIDPGYRQKMGDFDYGLRARAAGCSVWLAPGIVGVCATHPARDTTGVPLRDQLRDLWSVKNLPPAAWGRFTRRWGGPLWPLYWASPYVRGCVWLVLKHIRRRRPGRSV